MSIAKKIYSTFFGKKFKNNFVLINGEKRLKKTLLKSVRIAGKNNKIEIFSKCKNIGNIQINGNDNVVIFSSLCNQYDFRISISGCKNVVEIKDVSFLNSNVTINGNDNRFVLDKTINVVSGAEFYIADGSSVVIEKNCEIGNGKLLLIANGCYNTSNKIFIGEGTHIATDAIIRNSDGECLTDGENGRPLSKPKDVVIGKHCWITSRCTILKGTELPSGTIVAANSLVNKKFVQENTVIGGVPAKILKTETFWKEGSYKDNMIKYEKGEN